MDQENKTGAPQSDTTSALFVSARKKQLEQQEADRRAKEKEEQRLAAEAEVRRLEREVEERRRKTEEDAKNAEEEARRVAAESRAKMAEAAQNPDAVLGTQTANKGVKLPQMPKMPTPAAKTDKPAKAAVPPVGGGEAVAKAPLNVKLLAIIGGGVVVLAAVIIVLVMVLGGGDEADYDAVDDAWVEDAGDGMYYGEFFSFEYPTDWYVTGLDDTETLAGRVAVAPTEVFMESSDIGSLPFVVIADYSAAFETAEVETMDDLLTAFTDDMVNALSLTDYLGEPTDVQYQEAEELPDGSGMGYSVVLVFGDMSCFSQITLTNEGRVHGSIAMGIADEDADPINVVLMSIEPTMG